MTDDQQRRNDQGDEEETSGHATATSDAPLKPRGDVVVTHLDSPPSSSNFGIHPRRPAPIVPDRARQDTRVDSKKQ
jgi:hypothetical protein